MMFSSNFKKKNSRTTVPRYLWLFTVVYQFFLFLFYHTILPYFAFISNFELEPVTPIGLRFSTESLKNIQNRYEVPNYKICV